MRSRTILLPALVFCLGFELLAQTPLEAVRSYRRSHGAEILKDFARLLAIPNVAADTPNIRRNAEFLRDEFARRGAEMELLEVPGAPPVVYGRIDTPGADRTLLIYVHYDGQPVDESQWTQPPWRPQLYDNSLENGGRPIDWPSSGQAIDPEWRIYARSAGDDKAPIPALLGALDALKEAKIPLTSHIKFFFEGEEEAGSTHLKSFLETYKDRLEGDIWLFCDGPVHQSRTPQVVFGVRGIVDSEITVYGAQRYLHSGHYGNWAPNPAQRLARLLASMKDDKGRVLIKNFYDTVEPLLPAERQALEKIPDYDGPLLAELGLASSEGDRGLMESLLLPSLNVRGLSSATVGASARNVIPTQATASIDIRLVKGNPPEAMLDLLERHIRSQGYHIVRSDPELDMRRRHKRLAKVVRGSGYPAARTRMNLPLARQIVEAAHLAAGERGVLEVPSLGGSLPLYLFTDVLRSPVIILPIANHDDNQHAPDENLRLANLWYGIDLMASLLTM